jgi:hypothetical protein
MVGDILFPVEDLRTLPTMSDLGKAVNVHVHE